jgi:predicted CXXCH cytochrome family protein
MKLKKLVLLSSLFLGLVPLSKGQNIRGSSHDFTTKTQYNTTGELCIVCHAPHGTDPTAVPLWNHNTTSQIFSTYIGYKFPQRGGLSITQPDGASKLCLSCHDGVSAINQFGGMMQGTSSAPQPLTTNDRIGTDLTNDHPISFVYNTSLALLDGQLHDPATTPSSLGGTIATDMLDINGKLQCPSCHEVHDQTISRFLKMSNSASALCLTCHAK